MKGDPGDPGGFEDVWPVTPGGPRPQGETGPAGDDDGWETEVDRFLDVLFPGKG